VIVTKQECSVAETDIVCKIEVILESGFRNIMYFEEDIDIQEDAIAARLIEQSEDREQMHIACGKWDPIARKEIKTNAKW
jgi:hypothetical protein